MYNDLNNQLFRKYFSSEEREDIRVEAINLFSDITYFEEHMNRLKKSNFNFKVSFYERFNEKSLKKLFEDYSGLTLTSVEPSPTYNLMMLLSSHWGGGFLFCRQVWYDKSLPLLSWARSNRSYT